MGYSVESRREAGRIVSALLSDLTRDPSVVVIASGGGSVPIAFEVARQIEAPLEILAPPYARLRGPLTLFKAIVVDDSLAGPIPLQTVVSSVRSLCPTRLVLAVPYVSRDTRDRLLEEVDEFVWAILADSPTTVRALYDEAASVVPDPPASHVRLTRRPVDGWFWTR
jgi:predicted phosphoribosyltransferase